MQEQVADVAGFEFGRVRAPTIFAGPGEYFPEGPAPRGRGCRRGCRWGCRRGIVEVDGVCVGHVGAAPGARRGAARPAFDAAKVASVCSVEYPRATEATERRARRTPRPRGPGSRRGSPRRGPSAASSRPSSPRGSSRIRGVDGGGSFGTRRRRPAAASAAGRTKKDIFGTGGATPPPRSSRRGGGDRGGCPRTQRVGASRAVAHLV